MGNPYREAPTHRTLEVRTYDHVAFALLLLVVAGLAYAAGGVIALGAAVAIGVLIYVWRVIARRGGVWPSRFALAAAWGLFLWDFRLDLRTALSAVILFLSTVIVIVGMRYRH